MGPGRYKERNCCFHRTAAVDLVRERSPAVGDDGAGNGLEQDAVLVGYLVRVPNENAAGPIGHVGFNACGNEPHDLVMQKLPVTGMIFVPDHQIHCQSFQTPVSVGLDELAHQVDIGRIFNLQQHNRQIAGNGVAPETGLPPVVLDEDARIGAQRGIGVDDRSRQDVHRVAHRPLWH